MEREQSDLAGSQEVRLSPNYPFNRVSSRCNTHHSCWCIGITLRNGPFPFRARCSITVFGEYKISLMGHARPLTETITSVYASSTYPSLPDISACCIEKHWCQNRQRRYSEESRSLRYWSHGVFICTFHRLSRTEFDTHHRSGKVAEGVLSILQELPTVSVKVDDLPALFENLGELYLIPMTQ